MTVICTSTVEYHCDEWKCRDFSCLAAVHVLWRGWNATGLQSLHNEYNVIVCLDIALWNGCALSSGFHQDVQTVVLTWFSLTSMRTSSWVLRGTVAFPFPTPSFWSSSSKTMFRGPGEDSEEEDEEDEDDEESESLKERTGEIPVNIRHCGINKRLGLA